VRPFELCQQFGYKHGRRELTWVDCRGKCNVTEGLDLGKGSMKVNTIYS